MKQKFIMLFLVSLIPVFCFAGVDFVLGIKEFTLFSPDIDGFKVVSDGSSYSFTEAEIEGYQSVGFI